VLLVFDIKNVLSSRISGKMLQGRDFNFRNQAFYQFFPRGKKKNKTDLIGSVLQQNFSEYIKETNQKILMGENNASEKSRPRIRLLFLWLQFM